MSNDLNKCLFIGRLGSDPEIKYTASGTAVANISLAVGSQWKDKQTGQKQEATEWVRISAFGKLAEIIGQYVKKGSKIFIEGRYTTRKWQDQNGNDRYTTEIVASSMQMLDGKPASGIADTQPAASATSGQGADEPPPFDDYPDDDIPFS